MSAQMTATADEDKSHTPGKVREITLDHPWQWISKGWEDFRRAPNVSLMYGSLFFFASLLLTFLVFFSDIFFLVPPLAAGFFLLAPILAVGLYDNSRRLQKGEGPQVCSALNAWKLAPFNLSVMGVILMLVMIFWMMIANLIFAIFFSGAVLTFDNFFPVLFLSGDSPMFLIAGILSGGALALLVFSITVISVPMMLDRDVNVPSAIATSYEAVMKNPRPMMLWATLIVMFGVIGIFTMYIGLAIAMPVIGYASWHAYQDLVEPEN